MPNTHETYHCDQCPGSTFCRKSVLDRHRHTKHGGKPDKQCSMCTRAFFSKQDLDHHFATHDRRAAKRFTCEHCGRTFGRSFALNRHVRTLHQRLSSSSMIDTDIADQDGELISWLPLDTGQFSNDGLLSNESTPSADVGGHGGITVVDHDSINMCLSRPRSIAEIDQILDSEEIDLSNLWLQQAQVTDWIKIISFRHDKFACLKKISLAAAESGHIAAFEAVHAIDGTVALTACDSSKNTCLHLACKYSQYGIAKSCLDIVRLSDANNTDYIDLKNKHEKTALMVVVDKRDQNIFEILIDAGAIWSTETSVPIVRYAFATSKKIPPNFLASLLRLTPDGYNTRFKHGDTLLHLAIRNQNASHGLSLLRTSFSKVSYISIQNLKGETPLHLACQISPRSWSNMNARRSLVKNLLDGGADCLVIDNVGETPLHKAVANMAGSYWLRDDDVVELLLVHGADASATNASGMTPLHVVFSASITYHFDYEWIVGVLLEHGADCSKAAASGQTPLHYACMKGNSSCVNMLLKAGANVSEADSTGKTPLHYACSEGNAGCVSALLKAGASVAEADPSGRTPLHFACLKGNSSCIGMLLKAGANVYVRDSKTESPLHVAASQNHARGVIKVLLEHDLTELDQTDMEGNTALHKACSAGYIEAVETLLEFGANPSLRNRRGETPLHLSASRSYDIIQIARALLKSSAIGLDSTDSNGNTALHKACGVSGIWTLEIVGLLTEFGPNISLRNKRGETPLDLLAGNSQRYYWIISRTTEFMTLLGRLGVNQIDSKGNTALHKALVKGDLEWTKVLLKAGPNVSIRNLKGDSPLHLAVSSGNHEIVKLLLEGDLTWINETNLEGNTALDIAYDRDSSDLISMLLEAGATSAVTNLRQILPLTTASDHFEHFINGFDFGN